MAKLICFVSMPFGQKPDARGAIIDFDAVYGELIAPAVESVGMQPLRADDELIGGLIHQATWERVILSDMALFDLSTGNANVLYELGVRHATRRSGTLIMFENASRIPFDVAMLRAFQYRVDSSGRPA